MERVLEAPYPYFGGKSSIAPEVWKRFGNPRGYVEPFAGSAAMLLLRPSPFRGTETINDKDGFCSNFWRAIKADPQKVAEYADWPVIENDLHARHAWLVGRAKSIQSRLEGDPEWFSAKVAGWWCWGMCVWIGSGFCSGEGPWKVEDENGDKHLVRSEKNGAGVARKLLMLGASRGVARNLVYLGAGRGAKKCRLDALCRWFGDLQQRLERVRVCCGDWRRVCGGRDGESISYMVAGGECAVFLDPPYSDAAGGFEGAYREEDRSLSHDVCEWAIAHGNDERFRIALCGYEGEHEMPDDWSVLEWKTSGGFSNVSGESNENSRRERVWFSPHCINRRRGFVL